jgi:hypothetical protein
MRDCTGARRGAFCLLRDNKFGEGGEGKDYHIISDEIYLSRGDTQNEIIAKIGLPDSQEATKDGYEIWRYKSHSLELYFESGRLKFWR